MELLCLNVKGQRTCHLTGLPEALQNGRFAWPFSRASILVHWPEARPNGRAALRNGRAIFQRPWHGLPAISSSIRPRLNCVKLGQLAGPYFRDQMPGFQCKPKRLKPFTMARRTCHLAGPYSKDHSFWNMTLPFYRVSGFSVFS